MFRRFANRCSDANSLELLGPVAALMRHSHRAEPPKGPNVRPPRPVPFFAMRCLSASTPLCAYRARESPIVARVFRAIGRG